jgi:hypothetical protein
MKTKEEIAQWVINNRYTKGENDKVSDAEMYHELVESIDKLCNIKSVFVVCENDEYGRDLWICCTNTVEEAEKAKGRDSTRNIYEHCII